MRKLDLKLNPEMEREIYAAKETFDKTVNGLDVAELQVHTFGKNYIKNKKLSPDAIMHLAFQVRKHNFVHLIRSLFNNPTTWPLG